MSTVSVCRSAVLGVAICRSATVHVRRFNRARWVKNAVIQEAWPQLAVVGSHFLFKVTTPFGRDRLRIFEIVFVNAFHESEIRGIGEVFHYCHTLFLETCVGADAQNAEKKRETLQQSAVNRKRLHWPNGIRPVGMSCRSKQSVRGRKCRRKTASHRPY